MWCVQSSLIFKISDSSHNGLRMRQTSFSASSAAALVTIGKIIEYKWNEKNQALFKSGVGAWQDKNFDFRGKVFKTGEEWM